MSRLIILLESKVLSESLKEKIFAKYKVEALFSQSSKEIMSQVDFLPEIEVILCNEKVQTDKVAFELSGFLEGKLEEKSENQKPIHMVVLGNKSPYYPYMTLLEESSDIEVIVSHIGYLLGAEQTNILEQEPEPVQTVPVQDPPASGQTTVFQVSDKLKKIAQELSPDEYTSFSVTYFHHLEDVTFQFSAYTRIKKADSFDYNQKIKANTHMSKSEIEKMLIRCGKELYVPISETPTASEYLNNNFIQRFNNQELSLIDRMKLNSESYEVLLNIFKHSTFDKFNIEIVKSLIKSTDVTAKSITEKKQLFSLVKSEKLSYGYCHLLLTYYFIIQVIDKFSWSKDQSKNKILYLAVFHDLALHNDRLIKMHHHYLTDKSKLTPEEDFLILNHAQEAADRLEIIVKAPLELTSIIKEHHGMKSGKGIPDSLSFSLSPLMMAHIVVEDFVTEIYEIIQNNPEQSHDEKFKDVFLELAKKYQKLTYQEVLLELEALFKKPAT